MLLIVPEAQLAGQYARIDQRTYGFYPATTQRRVLGRRNPRDGRNLGGTGGHLSHQASFETWIRETLSPLAKQNTPIAEGDLAQTDQGGPRGKGASVKSIRRATFDITVAPGASIPRPPG